MLGKAIAIAIGRSVRPLVRVVYLIIVSNEYVFQDWVIILLHRCFGTAVLFTIQKRSLC